MLKHKEVFVVAYLKMDGGTVWKPFTPARTYMDACETAERHRIYHPGTIFKVFHKKLINKEGVIEV